ncbi:MAG: pyrroline-5-carboxylate reductase [Candidatus Omnitrophica bacterium]|nr:pyrroline-5-carboxylate reductase [Candidatus Omnitrophota bacterium]
MKIGLIGCGNMGEAIVSRLAGSTPASAQSIIATDVDKAKMNKVRSRYNVRVASYIRQVVRFADAIIIAVKPKDIDAVLEAMGPYLSSGKTIISIAAGITTGYIEKRIGKNVAVIRAMPNMPAVIGEAVSSISAGKYAAKRDVNIAKGIFSSIGDVVELNEKLVDSVTAVSGSGPAYFFYLTECLVEAAKELGLADRIAKQLAFKTALGSAKLLSSCGEGPAVLRARVASKGGTTEAAFRVLEKANFKGIVKRAVKRARKRSRELSKA